MQNNDKKLLLELPCAPTLAQFVVQMAAHRRDVMAAAEKQIAETNDPAWRQRAQLDVAYHNHFLSPAIDGAAASLPFIKRISYDGSVIPLVAATNALATEEVVGRLAYTTFPFDKFWVEGPYITEGATKPGTNRIGYLIEADQKKQEFTFQSMMELDHLGQSKRGNGLVADGVPIRVSAKDGILFDEDKFLASLEALDDVITRKTRAAFLRNEPLPPPRPEVSRRIDHIYEVAEGITRLLVVLGSERVPSNFAQAKVADTAEMAARNRRRQAKGKTPDLSTDAITIDLTRLNPRFLTANTEKEARILLGWTSVQRSKEIVSKHGKRFRRNPHDRRIPAPVDRRDATRELIASNPDVTVVVSAERPQLVRRDHPLAATNNTAPK